MPSKRKRSAKYEKPVKISAPPQDVVRSLFSGKPKKNWRYLEEKAVTSPATRGGPKMSECTDKIAKGLGECFQEVHTRIDFVQQNLGTRLDAAQAANKERFDAIDQKLDELLQGTKGAGKRDAKTKGRSTRRSSAPVQTLAVAPPD